MEQKEAPDADSQANQPGGKAPRLRLPQQSRLRRGSEFSRIFRHGVRVRGSTILLVATPGKHPGSARMGLSVGRKFSKKAVLRNRVRRVLRESFRLARPRLPHLDLILIPLARGHAYSVAECLPELEALAAKILPKWQRKQDAAQE